MTSTKLFLFLTLGIFSFATIFTHVNSKSLGVRKWKKEVEPLDPEGKYLLSWEVDLDLESVVFNVEVETRGFVGFGISPSGNMDGADIFISGVDSISGFNYAFDMHGIGNQAPIRDDHADWKLLEASENATHTSVKFSRLLNTCDNQDFAITEDTNRIIWSYGLTDDIGYHQGNRGSTSLNIIAPPTPDFDPSKYERWEISTNSTMTSKDTSYYCTMHKSPNFESKHHIVALNAVLDNLDAKKHTHHFTLMICEAPPGESPSDLFEPYLYPAYPGHDCYENTNPMPYYFCSKINYIWAVGGKMTVFPENIGLATPTGETYYYLEIHYDNPTLEVGKQFKTGLEIYHTTNLREIEAGTYIAQHSTDPQLLVPPMTTDFVIASNCPSQCTQATLPPSGITVFNVLLHSHLSGRKLKFRQFRDNQELPWIASDDYYDFNFQQNKPVKDPWPVILPGDDIRLECTYDTRWKNGQIVTGGLTSREEMCAAIFYYYPRIDVEFCSSAYPFPNLMEDLGVTNFTAYNPGLGPTFKATIHSPPELAGDFEEVLNTKFNWTTGFIDELRKKSKFADQLFQCGEMEGIVKYPVFDKEYAPVDKCLV
jgi:hypothetical protein